MFFSPHNHLFPVGLAPFVGCFEAEFAAAVLLLVEVVLTDDFDAAFAQAAFAPVLVPESDAANLLGGPFAGLINLVEAFPTRRCQSGCENLKAVGGGILSGAQKSVFL